MTHGAFAAGAGWLVSSPACIFLLFHHTPPSLHPTTTYSAVGPASAYAYYPEEPLSRRLKAAAESGDWFCGVVPASVLAQLARQMNLQVG